MLNTNYKYEKIIIKHFPIILGLFFVLYCSTLLAVCDCGSNITDELRLSIPDYGSNTLLAICDCGSNIPDELRLSIPKYGIGYTKYEKELGEAFRKDKGLFEQLFRLHVAKFSNISGSVINFKVGKKNVYRSAILSENIALLSELVKQMGVSSIVALTNTKIFNISPWIDKEKLTFSTLGGAQFIQIMDFDCDFDFNNKVEVQKAQAKVASIIKLIASLDDSILIHCLGGEHRTEVVFEVMQRCINKLDIYNITQRYKCHTGWESEENIGNYRQSNVDFIRSFPCETVEYL